MSPVALRLIPPRAFRREVPPRPSVALQGLLPSPPFPLPAFWLRRPPRPPKRRSLRPRPKRRSLPLRPKRKSIPPPLLIVPLQPLPSPSPRLTTTTTTTTAAVEAQLTLATAPSTALAWYVEKTLFPPLHPDVSCRDPSDQWLTKYRTPVEPGTRTRTTFVRLLMPTSIATREFFPRC